MKKSGAGQDLVVTSIVSAIAFLIAVKIDLFEMITNWSARHEQWEIDEFVTLTIVLTAALALFSYRRWRESSRELARSTDMELSLRETEEIHRLTLSSISDAVFVTDEQPILP